MCTLCNAINPQEISDEDNTHSVPTNDTTLFDVGIGEQSGFGFSTSSAAFNNKPVWSMDQVAKFLTHDFWGAGGMRKYASNTITYDFSQMSSIGQELARAAMDAWEAVADIRFVQSSQNTMLTFDHKDYGAVTWSEASNGVQGLAKISIAQSWMSNVRTGELSNHAYQTFLHEIGHALGLGHSGHYNGGRPDYGRDAIYMQDSWAYTVMSYFDQEKSGHGTKTYVVTPQMADIIAVQKLYGAAKNTNAGDSNYSYSWLSSKYTSNSSNERVAAYTIYDTGGIDTMSGEGYARDQKLNLNAESFSTIGNSKNNIAIARGVVIENAVGGGGNDVITGNSSDNKLTGGAGNDTLSGGGGADTFVVTRGAGADIIQDFQVGVDKIDALGLGLTGGSLSAAGITLSQSGSSTIVRFPNGEQITLLNVNVSQLTLNDFILTNQPVPPAPVPPAPVPPAPVPPAPGNNVINGDAGNNVLRGTAAIDTINGFGGNDIIFGSQGGDTIDGGAGHDMISYAHSATGVMVNLYRGLGYGGAMGDTYRSIESAHGSAFSDLIIGSHETNILDGNGGNDRLYGNGGNDVLNGGSGNDYLNGGKGNDVFVVNRDGTDVIADFQSGVDKIDVSGLGISSHALKAREITFTQSGGSTTVHFLDSAGNIITTITLQNFTQGFLNEGDFIFANGPTTPTPVPPVPVPPSPGNNVINGDEGNNVLRGTAASDTINGFGGDDIIFGSQGGDTIDGGAGRDTISYTHSATGVTVGLYRGLGYGGAMGDTYKNIENIRGSKFSDVLVGSHEANVIFGDAGNDQLHGNGGNDVLDGGSGNDYLKGGNGNDIFVVNRDGTDVIADFQSGVDKIDVSGLGISSHALKAREITFTQSGSSTTVHFLDSTGNIITTITLQNFTQGFLSGSDFIFANTPATPKPVSPVPVPSEPGTNVITGDTGDNTLFGSAGNDVIDGGAGNDYIAAGAGNDTLNGGTGSDILEGHTGADTINGGAGRDMATYLNSDAAVTVDLQNGVARGGTAEGDTLIDIEEVSGSQFNDQLMGDAAGNTLFGNEGNDLIEGRGGNDYLRGGTGADTFVFKAGFDHDVIGDFEDGLDRLDVSGMGLSGHSMASAGITISQSGGHTVIDFNTAGGEQITLTNTNAYHIDDSDFIF